MIIGPPARDDVYGALAAAFGREEDPEVRSRAAAALSHVMAGGLAADLAAGAAP
jgi:hypothetical protein